MVSNATLGIHSQAGKLHVTTSLSYCRIILMTVAAAEAAIGLAIVIAIFRNKLTVNIDQINLFKW